MRRVVFLVLFGLLLGAALTGLVGALPGSQDLTALGWLGTVSTVAALVVAVGIYQVQQSQNDAAHQELLDALKAQDEILQDLADTTPPGESPAPAEEPPAAGQARGRIPIGRDEALTVAQREAVEAEYGEGAVDAAWSLGPERSNRARLVRLTDGTLVSVTNPDRDGRIRVHQVRPRREGNRSPRDRRARRPKPPYEDSSPHQPR